MITKIINFVKEKEDKIILVIVIILISFLFFTLGKISSEQQEKEPLIFIQ